MPGRTQGLHPAGLALAGSVRCGACAALAGAGPTGLLYDRHWVLVDGSGAALTLRKCPALATIRPEVDLQRGVLRVVAATLPGEHLELPLPALGEAAAGAAAREEAAGQQHADTGTIGSGSGSGSGSSAGQANGAPGSPLSALSITVCSRAACGQASAATSGDAAEVSRWFERALGVPCRLVQQLHAEGPHEPSGPSSSSGDNGGSGGSSISSSSSSHSQAGAVTVTAMGPQRAQQAQQPRSYANEAQLLLLSSASLADLYSRTAEGAAAAGPSEGGGSGSAALPLHPAAKNAASLSQAGRALAAAPPAPTAAAGAPSAARPAQLAAFTRRFRPNLVVGGPGAEPYCEDGWGRVVLGQGSVVLTSMGPCSRCNMVTLDPATGR